MVIIYTVRLVQESCTLVTYFCVLYAPDKAHPLFCYTAFTPCLSGRNTRCVICRRHETLIHAHYSFILVSRSYKKDKLAYTMVTFLQLTYGLVFILATIRDTIVIGRSYLF